MVMWTSNHLPRTADKAIYEVLYKSLDHCEDRKDFAYSTTWQHSSFQINHRNAEEQLSQESNQASNIDMQWSSKVLAEYNQAYIETFESYYKTL